jgi:hypothetical protein
MSDYDYNNLQKFIKQISRTDIIINFNNLLQNNLFLLNLEKYKFSSPGIGRIFYIKKLLKTKLKLELIINDLPPEELKILLKQIILLTFITILP